MFEVYMWTLDSDVLHVLLSCRQTRLASTPNLVFKSQHTPNHSTVCCFSLQPLCDCVGHIVHTRPFEAMHKDSSDASSKTKGEVEEEGDRDWQTERGWVKWQRGRKRDWQTASEREKKRDGQCDEPGRDWEWVREYSICMYYGSPLAAAKAAATLPGVQNN